MVTVQAVKGTDGGVARGIRDPHIRNVGARRI
jgi:hypothetical protein